MKVAVVGSGVSGPGATWARSFLSFEHEVHLYEAYNRPGGHANTVEFTPRERNQKTVSARNENFADRDDLQRLARRRSVSTQAGTSSAELTTANGATATYDHVMSSSLAIPIPCCPFLRPARV
ncbi:hypothetical protein DFH07DRAFT_222021 [Mycena maculata]|uniref:Uncharacterized protein n=1 Tax=Mycena maculata TaxID=230809 RepID=A0AAD7MQR5_9AGAR|nr:hypothetical protein DFH07DRAFT_222021 [Mycena maculata]